MRIFYSNLILFQVQDATNAKLAFLIPILTDSKEMVIHVIGEEILDTELRFSVSPNFLKMSVK